MRSFKGIALAIGTTSIATNVETNSPVSPCGFSTVYVTVTGSPVTETVLAGSTSISSASNDGVTATSSIFSTAFVTVAYAASSSIGQAQGPYSFSENNVTTTWLGAKTPPAPLSFVTATSYVTLQPVPEGSSVSAAVTTVNEQITRVYTVGSIITETLPLTIPTSRMPDSGKAYTGLAPSGWNATTLMKFSTGPSSAKPLTKGKDKTIALHGMSYPTAFPSHKVTGYLKARGYGSTVVATMDGAVVSWANDYNGSASAMPLPEVSVSSTVPVGAYPWDATSEASSAVTPESNSCGQSSALFTITFDDLPHFSPSDPSTAVFPPIFNPYRKLYFDNHFSYVPPPSDPFSPHSSPQLAVFRTTGIGAEGSPDAGLESPGEIGAGPHASDNAYWINAHSVWLGCSDGGPTGCEVTIDGYTYGNTVPTTSQTITSPPCPGLKNCSLSFVPFNEDMVGLVALQINAAVAGKAVDYYIDDLKLEWSNNTCAAQLERSSSE